MPRYKSKYSLDKTWEVFYRMHEEYAGKKSAIYRQGGDIWPAQQHQIEELIKEGIKRGIEAVIEDARRQSQSPKVIDIPVVD